ncbi:hypothetical protein DsansV1_C12g0115091 [Dioscorea sansibarensis]
MLICFNTSTRPWPAFESLKGFKTHFPLHSSLYIISKPSSLLHLKLLSLASKELRSTLFGP